MQALSNLLRSAVLSLALIGGAQATNVSIDFSVSGVAGEGSGSFQFDDSLGSTNLFDETEFVLTGFAFSFGGRSYGADDLQTPAWVVFDGSTLLGLDATAAGFSFVPAMGGHPAFLVTGRSSSTLTLGRDGPQPVPEPGSAALGLLAGAVLWSGRRRLKARR